MKCKKCNVILADYLKKCPLCGEKTENKSNNGSYNLEIENFSKKVNIFYFSKITIKTLLLANIICMICNLSINKTISWSLYVLFSSLYLASFGTYLTIKDKKIAFVINMLFLELLLFMISFLTHTTSWFIYLVGPFILLFIIYVLLNIYLSKHNNILRNVSCLLIYIAFCLNIINACINLYKHSKTIFTWSITANIPIFIISVILLILSFNKTITDEIEKRFFI